MRFTLQIQRHTDAYMKFRLAAMPAKILTLSRAHRNFNAYERIFRKILKLQISGS